MSKFIQIHVLTSYPPANLNRDDLGRPKTAIMGGAQRLRISSQSLKRAWRTSEIMQQQLNGHIGVRTKLLGKIAQDKLLNGGIDESKAKAWANQIAARFGKVKKDSVEIEQLAHFAPEEIAAVHALVDQLITEERAPTDDELTELQKRRQAAADIAMFGRMLADSPTFNIEAAVQVAHAISVHEVALEDDFFTAVDDLNAGLEDLGAGHMGEVEFAAGLFYIYVCIDTELLTRNLTDNKDLAVTATKALLESIAKIAPTGKQATFASRAYASYIQVEKGEQQPRSLSVAFLRPITGRNILADAIKALEETKSQLDNSYGKCSDDSKVMNSLSGTGSFAELFALLEE